MAGNREQREPTAFAGFCSYAAWEGDVLGRLIRRDPDGWRGAGFHISSDELWSKHDIGTKFEEQRMEGDTYEWLGFVDTDGGYEAFVAEHPPAPADGPAEGQEFGASDPAAEPPHSLSREI